MKILLIGGTGLLGSEAARQFIDKGHEVQCIALPPLPIGAPLPDEMHISYGNYMTMTEVELREQFNGCDGLVFAAGVDERVEGPAPIYSMFKKYNIDALKRLMAIALECGIKHTVICGSYFAYFEKIQKNKELSKWHPYIRSRRDQERMALSFANRGMDVAVLELPYIFGTQPGRKPVWMFLAESVRKMKGVTLYPRGGSAMVTVKQVGQAIVGAMEKNKGGKAYPIGYYNMTWKAMLKIVHKQMNLPKRKVLTIPDCIYALSGKQIMRQQLNNGFEGGLHMVKFTNMMCDELFIEPSLACDFLGVKEDNIEKAIGQSIQLCLDIIDQQTTAIDMKGE